MTRITYTLIFLLALTQLKGQKNQYDNEGKLHGLWEFFDSNDNLILRGNYENGTPVDTLLFFKNNTVALKIYEIENGKIWFSFPQKSLNFFRLKKEQSYIYQLTTGELINPTQDLKPYMELGAVFFGGSNTWNKYLADNLVYPEKMARRKKEGSVKVSFVVNSKGAVGGLKIIDSSNKRFKKSVVELFDNMPKWQPGLQRGHPISARMTTTINFAL
ncbi:energy transducer TonB [Roseivirga pacifica]